ncbi:MAG: PQQ-binding-like beta-propeller repeat protein [Sedimentisphaerales bacterium]|nr:PQQ-binding-like beta-propeller repeat protein [Sedimentisphaerales bacterium]
MKKATVWTIVMVAACVLGVSGCRKPAAEQPLLSKQDLTAGDLKEFWAATLPLEKGETILHLYCERGNLYAVSSTNQLRCVDAFSGRIKWTVKLCDDNLTPSPVSQLGADVAYVAVIDKLYSFLADTGQPLPPRRMNMAPSTRLFIAPPFVYFGTHEGWMVAEHVTNRAQSWDRLTHAPIISAPVAAAGKVYFANEDGEVVASDGGQRHVEWTFKARDAFEGDLKLSATQGLVVAACRDYSVYALNPTSGHPAWICTTGDPILKAPFVYGNRIYVLTEPHVLLSLDELDGERPLWSVENVGSFLAASPRALYVLMTDGNIAALSHRDGSVLFILDGQLLDVLALNEIDGQLFVANRKGRIVAIREVKGKYDEDAAKAASPTGQKSEDALLIE